MTDKILVIGACGQIGTELVLTLRTQFGNDNIIASDIREGSDLVMESGPFEKIDVMDKENLFSVIKKHGITKVYHLAALLSATAEQRPKFGWDLNMEGLFNVLDLAKEAHISKIFWPSSIAVFGPTTPKQNTPQRTVMEPTTVYGISKQAGERWCEYYFNKYNVDVRGVRYPGLISYKSLPGGGTTDYAVDIFYKAKANQNFECFLKEDTVLPMMYMDDAINATIGLLETKADNVKIRSSYNISGISFDPKTISQEIQKHCPDFKTTYNPDFRQAIADSWPQSIDDSVAHKDWNWSSKFDLGMMVDTMLKNIKTN